MAAQSPLALFDVDGLVGDDDRAIRDTVRAFVDDRIKPNVADWYEAGYYQRSPRQELEASDAVFIGVVTRVQRFEKTRKNMNRMTVTQIYVVHFTPKRFWKGSRSASIQVESPDPEYDDCGIDFVSGEEYLVYAAGSDKLTTDRCRRTKVASQAAEDLSVLGQGE